MLRFVPKKGSRFFTILMLVPVKRIIKDKVFKLTCLSNSVLCFFTPPLVFDQFSRDRTILQHSIDFHFFFQRW